MADAALCCALEGRLLCGDGLERLEPAERTALLRALDEHPERLVLLAPTRSGALTLGDRTVLLVEVPMPTFAERQAAWSELTGAERHARRQREVPALADPDRRRPPRSRRITAHSRNGDAPEPADLDRGARHASSSRLGELATQLTPRYRWADLVLPDRQREVLGSISAYLRHRDRVLSEWGYERAVARTQGLKVLFAGESGTGKTMAAEVLGAELGLELFRVDLATIVSKYIGETEKNLDRIFEAATGSNAILFFDEADALFGKRSRGLRRARPLRQHRGRLPAAEDGGLPGRGHPRHQLPPEHRRRVRAPARLRDRLPVPRGRGPQADLAAAAARARRRSTTTSTSSSSRPSSSSPAARSATARWPPRSRPPTRGPRSRCAT